MRASSLGGELRHGGRSAGRVGGRHGMPHAAARSARLAAFGCSAHGYSSVQLAPIQRMLHQFRAVYPRYIGAALSRDACRAIQRYTRIQRCIRYSYTADTLYIPIHPPSVSRMEEGPTQVLCALPLPLLTE